MSWPEAWLGLHDLVSPPVDRRGGLGQTDYIHTAHASLSEKRAPDDFGSSDIAIFKTQLSKRFLRAGQGRSCQGRKNTRNCSVTSCELHMASIHQEASIKVRGGRLESECWACSCLHAAGSQMMLFRSSLSGEASAPVHTQRKAKLELCEREHHVATINACSLNEEKLRDTASKASTRFGPGCMAHTCLSTNLPRPLPDCWDCWAMLGVPGRTKGRLQGLDLDRPSCQSWTPRKTRKPADSACPTQCPSEAKQRLAAAVRQPAPGFPSAEADPFFD